MSCNCINSTPYPYPYQYLDTVGVPPKVSSLARHIPSEVYPDLSEYVKIIDIYGREVWVHSSHLNGCRASSSLNPSAQPFVPRTPESCHEEYRGLNPEAEEWQPWEYRPVVAEPQKEHPLAKRFFEWQRARDERHKAKRELEKQMAEDRPSSRPSTISATESLMIETCLGRGLAFAIGLYEDSEF